MDNLTFDKLKKVVQEFEDKRPQYNRPEIDEMISNGAKISELAMIHSIPELRDTHKLKTKHGDIEVVFSGVVEYGQGYIVKKPTSYLTDFDIGFKGIGTTEST